MTFLAAHAGGHPSGCPHRAGLILSKKKKKRERKKKKKKKRKRNRAIAVCLNFGRSVIGCIEADCCNQRLILQHYFF